MEDDVVNPYRAFRQLERQLFLGVPEGPEHFWEREGNYEMQGRLTGRSHLVGHASPLSLKGAQTVATIIYRPESGEILFEFEIPPRKEESDSR